MHRSSFLPALLVLGACATTSQRAVEDGLLEGFAVDEVREAARHVVADVAHPRSVVRVTDDRVITDGRIGVCGQDVACGESTRFPNAGVGTPWTTIEVHLMERGADTAVEVDVDYETRAHCRTERRSDANCSPERLGSTGALERRILTELRARLESARAG